MIKAVMTKRELVEQGYCDYDLDRIMHSDEAWKVGFHTDGGQFRFIVEKLNEFLQQRTRYRA